MGRTTINQIYFEWLLTQIALPRDRTYNELLRRMHEFEFIWTVPNDDNRIQDALDLRGYFLTEGKPHHPPVSVLEVLISLSRHVAFTASGSPEQWAWRLIKNLRLGKMSDPLTDYEHHKIGEVLYALVWRTYQSNGQGGFFPLQYPEEDQTKVEIWYQMNKYVIERDIH
jgi:hypothetical protein